MMSIALKTLIGVSVALFIALPITLYGSGRAVSQSGICAPYFAAVVGDQTAKSASPISDQLLADYGTAVPCLVSYLKALQSAINSPNLHQSDVLDKFMRATGGIRTMMSNNQNQNDVIALFRNNTGLEVTSVLTYGARSDDYNARLNSMFILANVIDNTTVCVPLDHLYDPKITVNGRANLLSVVSVVAPWAYRKNYDNIKILYSNWKNLSDIDPASQTRAILENINSRLESQTDNSNKSERIPSQYQRCKGYKPVWAKTEDLKY